MPIQGSDCHSHYLVSLSFGSGDEWSQVAFVTFKDAQGAETALLLSVSCWKAFVWFSGVLTMLDSIVFCYLSIIITIELQLAYPFAWDWENVVVIVLELRLNALPKYNVCGSF